MTEYPVFPLDVVVFPGMTVPLTAFEERYKRLVRYCLEADERRFVIAKQPSAAPIRDTPVGIVPVGTMVDMLSVREDGDGSYEVVVHGQGRCDIDIVRTEHVLELDGTRRALDFTSVAESALKRDDPNRERVVAWDTIETFRDYARTFFEQRTQGQLDEHLPADPYYQASYVCANIRVPLESRQVLLEASSLTERFYLARKMMLELLRSHRKAESSADAGDGVPGAEAVIVEHDRDTADAAESRDHGAQPDANGRDD